MSFKSDDFDVYALFNSLSREQRERINYAISVSKKKREKKRYARLQQAETNRNNLVGELDHIEYEIAENDDWFAAAKEGRTKITPRDLDLHRRKAGERYTRKRLLIDRLLPEATSWIQSLIYQIETEEAQDERSQRIDLEYLLRPFYEARELERSKVLVANARERRRLEEEREARWQEEEAFRENEYEKLLERLRAEEAERRLVVEEAQRAQRANSISAQAYARKIPYLVHFTPIENVASIVQTGLRARSTLGGSEFFVTDEYRSDGWLDWISVSVSFPNYKMFYAKRNSLKNVNGWAIVLIKVEALWKLDCKFILTNASSFGIRMFRDDKWSSAEAFDDMFSHVQDRNGIPENFTTDPQAEVMIKNVVPLEYIAMIAVERRCDAFQLNTIQDIPVKVIPELFKWRSDFEHWRQYRLSPFGNQHEMGSAV